MADGILGLLGAGVDKVQGLLSNPTVQGLGAAAAFGFNPLLGLLAAPGIKNARERKALENDVLRQSLLDARRQSETRADLAGLINQETHVPVSAPIGLMNVGGGETLIPATRRQAVPTVATPGGQDKLMGLLAQLAPEELARSVFSNSAVAPEFKTDVGKLFGDLELAEGHGNLQAAQAIRSAIEAKLQDEGVDFDDLRAARNDTIKNSEPFLVARGGYNRVVASANSATPAGDLALTFGLMKILDPTSVVREGEQATVRNAGSIPERIRGFYNRILTGETLTPEQRADFVAQANAQFGKVVEQQNALIEDARGFAERNKLPVADVVPEFVVPNFTQVDAPERSSFADDPLVAAATAAIDRATGGAKTGGARVADIARMSLEKLQRLDLSKLSDEALEAAEKRWNELNGG